MTLKKASLSLILFGALFSALFTACNKTPKQSECTVEVYTPLRQYTKALLIDSKGEAVDSTLQIKNDSIIFKRNDIKEMPYIVTLTMINTRDSLDILNMPLVIEGGTVKLELTDKLSLSGTEDNDKLFKFLKSKNKFLASQKQDSSDFEQQKKDISRYFLDQFMQNKDNIVGSHIFDVYSQFMTSSDYMQASEVMKQAKAENGK